MNKKENWLRLMKNDQPGWIGLPWEPFAGFFFESFIGDPIQLAAMGPAAPGYFKDQWGTTWHMLEGHFPNPYITDENKVVKDITHWRDYVTFPPLDGHDWSQTEAFVNALNREETMIIPLIAGGLFERSHYLMGFEDALCAYLEEPEHMYDLIGAIADWKIEHLRQVIDRLQPEVIHYHDDWGCKTNVFLPPEVWRKIIKPHHKRIVDFVKSKGTIMMHHSDSFCEPLVEDMAELGIDIWQGVIPQNDIVKLQKQLGGRMALMGGIDAQVIDKPEADEQVIRGEVRRCIDTYCPQGNFIPCIPNLIPIFPQVKEIYEDELLNYGKAYCAGSESA